MRGFSRKIASLSFVLNKILLKSSSYFIEIQQKQANETILTT